MLEPGCLPHSLEEVPSKSKRYTFSHGSFTSGNLFHLNADVYLNLFNSPSAFPLSSSALKRSKASPVHVALHPPAAPGEVPILNTGPGHGCQSFSLHKMLQQEISHRSSFQSKLVVFIPRGATEQLGHPLGDGSTFPSVSVLPRWAALQEVPNEQHFHHYSPSRVSLFSPDSALSPNQGPNHWRTVDFSCGASLCTHIFTKLQFKYAIIAETMDLKV